MKQCLEVAKQSTAQRLANGRKRKAGREKNEEMENVQYIAIMAFCGLTAATPVQRSVCMNSQKWWDHDTNS